MKINNDVYLGAKGKIAVVYISLKYRYY